MNQPLFGFNQQPQQPASRFSFGNAPSNNTPIGYGNASAWSGDNYSFTPQPFNASQEYGLSFGNASAEPSILNMPNAFEGQQGFGFNTNAGTVVPSIDTSMTGGDMLNFGGGMLQAGIGAYYQNEANDLARDNLQLSRDKYANYLSEKQSLRDAGDRRLAKEKAAV